MGVKITGLAEASRELSRQIAAIEGRSREGLLQAGLFIEAEAVDMAPVDTGTLRGSAFTDVTAPGATPIAVRVGFTAEYAAYVHEMERKSDVGPRQDRSTAATVGPRREPRGYNFVGPRKPRRKGGTARKHTPWAPGTGPKFLQRAVSENVAEILGIVARAATIPGGGGNAE